MPDTTSFPMELIAPESGQPLVWDSAGTQLQVAGSDVVVPVRNGIPRFTQAEHLESFGRQWTRYEVFHDDEDRVTFQAKTGFDLGKLNGLRILDAGCGGGRYCKVAGEAGAEVIGIDYTHAVDKAAKLCGHLPNVHLIQGDLKRLPFAEESFDRVFSIGVMHHDANTRAVFDSVARMTRAGGWYSVWLYRRNQWWQERINDALRARTITMDPDKLERWCTWGAWLGGLPVVNRTLNKVVNFSAHPSYENRVCDTFDWYAPQYQHHHTVEELCDWFTSAGYVDLKILPPEKQGRLYQFVYEGNLLIGSGVNVTGRRA
ncbi:MAG: class I SAM-dependent methyltransferase [Planctomycetaceae bacterium]|nr:class I SAM-dependent methyltransferase [Planctomycetaceae bacterium]